MNQGGGGHTGGVPTGIGGNAHTTNGSIVHQAPANSFATRNTVWTLSYVKYLKVLKRISDSPLGEQLHNSNEESIAVAGINTGHREH